MHEKKRAEVVEARPGRDSIPPRDAAKGYPIDLRRLERQPLAFQKVVDLRPERVSRMSAIVENHFGRDDHPYSCCVQRE